MSPPLTCSLIIPTRNRRAVLEGALQRLLATIPAGCEVIVVDNASDDDTPALARRFSSVHWIGLSANLAAAARNVAAAAARAPLLLMLDDDSWPEPRTIERAVELFARRPDLGAAGCRVRLAAPPHGHDAGGVPGVIFNCGGFVRTAAFLDAGGYPTDYEYYVEEYALCCRLLQCGWRIEPHGFLRIRHARVTTNRDNHRMLRLLVRNNVRLWRRYAPPARREALIARTLERYRRVAVRENALAGYEAGVAEATAEDDPIRAGHGPASPPDRRTTAAARSRDDAPAATMHTQPLFKARTITTSRSATRRPLTESQFESLYGLDAAGRAVDGWRHALNIRRVAVWTRGKGCEELIELIADRGPRIAAVYDFDVDSPTRWDGWTGALSAPAGEPPPLLPTGAFEPETVDGVIIGTLSPGTSEDLRESFSAAHPGVPVLSAAPWHEDGASTFVPCNVGRARLEFEVIR